eukprot:TRINITY_DN3325_c0_g1_i1.p1 TRINITY_DN3325_c0_g1~~TRINITY_DN3325_c0_g1_i1.p1  ORF type:complete len:302 (-),score=60.59 TRINITY_DN3325_c0_g1_i1:232-1137(-)
MNMNKFKSLIPKVTSAYNSRNGGGGFGLLLSALGLVGMGVGLYESFYTVEGGHRGVMFSRLHGVKKEIIPEGTHIRMPWFEYPHIFDIRTKPMQIRSPTGTKDLQMVDITLRVLYKPEPIHLPEILSSLGQNFADRVLYSIVNETLKSVIAQYNASQLITMRDAVSRLIRRNLMERAKIFNIEIDDVSITHLTFSKEYTAAVEAKQVAQQDAERAKFVVKQATQDKRSTIIKAQGEAKGAELIGQAVARNPGFIELRQLEAAKNVASIIAKSQNKVYLNSDALLLNPAATEEAVRRLENRS